MEIISLNTFMRDRIAGTLTANSTANVEGNWITLYPYSAGVADTTWTLNYDVGSFYLHIDSASSNADYWIDIGYTDGTNTFEILSDFRIHSDVDYIGRQIYIPLSLPKGYDIQGRIKSNVGGASIWCALFLVPQTFTSQNFSAYKRYDIQVNTDNYGNIVEITNSTPFNVKHIIISISLAQINTIPSSQFWWFKLYIGATGSETEIFPIGDGLDMAVESGTDEIFANPLSYPIHIPKGERLAISHDVSISTQSTFDYSIYLFG